MLQCLVKLIHNLNYIVELYVAYHWFHECIKPAMSHAIIYNGPNEDPIFNITKLLEDDNIDVRLFSRYC